MDDEISVLCGVDDSLEVWRWVEIEPDEELLNRTDGTTERSIALSLLTRLTNSGTRGVYRRDINSFMNWWHDSVIATRTGESQANGPLQATKADLDAYLRYLVDSDDPEFSPATINRKIAVVSSFFDQACDMDYREINPAHRLKRPRIDNEEARTGLSAADAGLLMAVAEGWPDLTEGTLVILLLTHGLRVSEAVNLRAEDLIDDGGHLKVKTNRKGRAGKSPITIDDFDLHQRLTKLAERNETRVFGPMNRFKAARSVSRLGLAAGIKPSLYPHILRHTFVAQALRAGYTIEEVRKMAGHASIETTQRYARAIENERLSIGLDMRRYYESARLSRDASR